MRHFTRDWRHTLPVKYLTPPSRIRFAQTAFISVLPPTTIKSPRATSAVDFKNKHL